MTTPAPHDEGPRRPRDAALPVPVQAEAADSHGVLEPEAIRSLVWPRRPVASIGATIAVAMALLVPVVVAAPDPLLAVTAAVPILALAYVTRLVFEALLPRTGSYVRRVTASILAAGFGLGFVALIAAMLALDLSTAWIATAAAAAMLVLLAAAAVRDLEQRLGTSNRRIVFVGPAHLYRDLASEISRRGDLHLAGHMSSDSRAARDRDDVAAELEALRPSTLVLSAQASRDEQLVAAAARLHARGVRIRSLQELYEQEFRKVAIGDLSSSWFLFDVAAIHHHRAYGGAKRLIETAAAGVLLVLSAPLFPVIAVAIRLSGPGPILFRQVRVGRNGEHIRLSKFRTMRPAENGPAEWASSHAARITPVGRVLRRFRLDELPQLLSVVRGDLALVGPRPEQPAIVERLRNDLEFYDARHCVRPGLTGWAQINHGYGASMRDVVAKLQYEFFYIKHQSLMLDLRVIVGTIRTILSGQGR